MALMRDWRAFVRERVRLDDLEPGREARIVRELAVQLEDFYREALARGASDADADAHARAQVTNWERLVDDLRRVERVHWRPAADRLVDRAGLRSSSSRRGGLLMLAHALQDIRYAIRQFLKTPAFTIVSVLTLAVGIGVTTAMFSVINGVLLRSLPYPESERLMRVHEVIPRFGRFSVAPATFLD